MGARISCFSFSSQFCLLLSIVVHLRASSKTDNSSQFLHIVLIVVSFCLPVLSAPTFLVAQVTEFSENSRRFATISAVATRTGTLPNHITSAAVHHEWRRGHRVRKHSIVTSVAAKCPWTVETRIPEDSPDLLTTWAQAVEEDIMLRMRSGNVCTASLRRSKRNSTHSTWRISTVSLRICP